MIHRIGFTPDQLNELAKSGIQKHLGLYLGPFLLGFAFDSMLLGCIIQQLVWNIIWCPSDRLFNKIILFSTVALSFITTIFNDAFLFHCFASGFGNWYRVLQLDWIMWFPVLDSVTVTLVQIFYLERAYQLHSRAKWVPIVVLPFILTAIGGALGSTVTASKLPDAYDLTVTYPAFYTWIGATLISDLLITSIIFYKLIKSKTGWSETDLMINKLITISVETQLPSLMVAIAFMVSYGIKPDSAVNVFFELFHPKVHVVGLLTVLNSRNKLRNQLNGPVTKENTFNQNVKLAALNPKIVGYEEFEATPQPTVILEDGIIVPHLGTTISPTLDVSMTSKSTPPIHSPHSETVITPKEQSSPGLLMEKSESRESKMGLKDMLDGTFDNDDLVDDGDLSSGFK